MKRTEKKRSPLQKRSIKTKDKLFKSGIKLFNKKGYFNTNSKEIAIAAGVAVGSFYAYYKDKKDLLIAIYLQNLRNLDKEMSILLKNNFKKNHTKILTVIINEILNFKKYPLICSQEILLLAKTDKDFLDVYFKGQNLLIQYAKIFFKSFKDKIYGKNLEEAAFLLISLIEKVRVSMQYTDRKISKRNLQVEIGLLMERYLFRCD